MDFSFDERVAKKYDTQRAYPPAVAEQIGQAVAAHAGGRTLEIGVGTGRIAKPFAASGVPIVGIDLSRHMLAEINADLPVAQADMHYLPFADTSFDAILVVHVLHLAQDWQQVLRECARVLRSDGRFMRGDDWVDPESVIGQLRHQMRLMVMKHSPDLRPPAAGISKQDFLADLGGTETETLTAVEWVEHISPTQRLDEIRSRIDSESWIIPDKLFDQILADLHTYAVETWDDIEAPLPVRKRFILTVTSGDW